MAIFFQSPGTVDEKFLLYPVYRVSEEPHAKFQQFPFVFLVTGVGPSFFPIFAHPGFSGFKIIDPGIISGYISIK